MSMDRRTFLRGGMAALGAGLLAACGAQGGASAGQKPATAQVAAQADGKKPQVVCTLFPVYDWLGNIIGDSGRAQVVWLNDGGADLHSYQPSVADMATIAAADLFVYVDGESDEWVKDALASATNANQRSVSLLSAIGSAAKEEELVEGMEADHEAEHEGEEHETEAAQEAETEAGHDHEEHELDEHVWLSLKNAQVIVTRLADELSSIDSEGASAYVANAAAYNEKLAKLDAAYASELSAAPLSTLLFGDRFPFRYLVDDYGLSYFAAFAGCSAETEASFNTVAFLAGKLDELKLPAVLTLEGSDQRIAQTIIQNSASKSAEIYTVDSLQSTSAGDAGAGDTYLSVMENNKDVLVRALGGTPGAAA